MRADTAMKTVLLAALGLLAVTAALCLGSAFISPVKIARLLWEQTPGPEYEIIFRLRLPRILMAFTIGAALAVSGVLFQALLRNPLSDPYTIGVSGGAAFGASIAIILLHNSAAVVLLAFGGSMAVVFLVFLLSRKVRIGSTALILGGIALSFILNSALLLLFAVSRSQEVHQVLFWLMGDLSIGRFGALGRIGALTALAITLSFFYHRHLNISAFGESFAKNLGVRRGEIRNIFWLAALLAALSVSLGGVIGFVGLIIPHAIRYLFGSNHGTVLPAAALGGGLFLVLSDTLGRSIAPPYEIPVGIITGFLGGIFFLVLLLGKRSIEA